MSAETSEYGSLDPLATSSPRDKQTLSVEPELFLSSSDEQSEFIRLAVEVQRHIMLVAPAGYEKSLSSTGP